MTWVTGLVGIVMLSLFLGTLVWWIKELPFTIIVVLVVAMVIYDLARSVRDSDSGPDR